MRPSMSRPHPSPASILTSLILFCGALLAVFVLAAADLGAAMADFAR